MPIWVERWRVRSHTNSDKEYVVSLADDGETWGCSCPAWKFQRHRIRDGICKHIRQIQHIIEEMRFAEEEEQEEILIAEEWEEEKRFIYPDNVTHDDFFTEEEFVL